MEQPPTTAYTPDNSQQTLTDEKIKNLSVARPDRHIWGIYIALVMVSLVELYSASSREISMSGALGIYGPLVRHMGMLSIGLAIMLVLQRIHYRRFLKWIPLFAFVSLVMMLFMLKFGDVVNGARRSISAFGFQIQPSEFLKLSAAAMIALVMALNQQKGSVRQAGIWISLGIVGLFTVLLMPQGLTNTLLLLAISGSMMVVSGVPIKKMALAVAALIAVVAALYGIHLMAIHFGGEGFLGRLDVWMGRLGQFFDPSGIPDYEKPIDSKNAQEMYGYMAQAHGGIFGVGPGNSREVARLPLAFSDYIYSIIVEETGLIGGLVVLAAYLWLLARASAIASKCYRAFPALLVIAMALVIVYQALFHIAIVVGAFPVSGQPLPLISKGGTSILITSIAFGVMLSVSRYAVRTGDGNQRKDINLELEILPEEARAENPSQLD